MIYIGILLIAFASIAEASMDVLNFHYYKSIFKNWNPYFWGDPASTYTNKYLNGDVDLGPKFWGSTTIFVFLTDGWHLCKFLKYLNFVIGFSLLLVGMYNYTDNPFLIILIPIALARFIRIVFFNLFFDKILKLKL
jgi:hypothetical protein